MPVAVTDALTAREASEASPAGTPAPLSDALPKTYDPAGTEARWQAAWEQAGAFHPDPAAPGNHSLW